ncbi:MAG: hypothetical protein GFH27_549313n82 [Chloroflexi bacterium AL-W]|nr:hypothetical protein [Chloroflexi bacterium AL-N1]NOK69505.1 hypothetical protein [Chloroflexi bacterium AL-N10]NOK77470.1 hypothetical protein [Chloroflexi bacterium AL-N5]NOK84321.1 hypothetical protein [Chloroflexi bacterium AL-W]NOK91513.1 hypothetical protein [Chloroflexi bacterium AL-N15]
MRLFVIIIHLLSVALGLGACNNSENVPTISLLNTELFITQQSSNIEYRLQLSEPATVILSLESNARVTELTFFECSTIPLTPQEQPCIIEGFLENVDPASEGTINLIVEPSNKPGTSAQRNVSFRTDSSGKFDF